MQLSRNWKQIVKKAWSFRLFALAGVLTTCEMILPLYVQSLPRSLFAALSLIVITAALIARVVAQRDLP